MIRRGNKEFEDVVLRAEQFSPALVVNPGTLTGTRWRGKIGSSPAELRIFANTDRGWRADVVYAGVRQDLSVEIKSDGTIVLTEIRVDRLDGQGVFKPATFRGR